MKANWGKYFFEELRRGKEMTREEQKDYDAIDERMHSAEAINRDLISLCNNHFIKAWYQPYAGANYECLFCCASLKRDHKTMNHEADCPVMVYQDILNKKY